MLFGVSELGGLGLDRIGKGKGLTRICTDDLDLVRFLRGDGAHGCWNGGDKAS